MIFFIPVVEMNAFFVQTAAGQGWLSPEQVAATEQALAADPSLSACDFMLRQGWLGQEHVDWLRQMAEAQSNLNALQTSARELKSRPRGPSTRGASSVKAPVPSAELQAADLSPLKAVRRYEPGGLVAKGGMGAIVHARDVPLRRSVAMKVMLEAQAEKEEVMRFVDEAQITGQLEHPNIVPVHDLAVNENGRVFYTMKFVRGTTLHEVLKGIRERRAEIVARYPLAHLLTIFQKVCDAMAFAHSKGVIHRDLKPENVMIGDYGEVLVMDWGLAKVLEREDGEGPGQPRAGVSSARRDEGDALRTMDGQIMGTPMFMSPEQARGRVHEIDARSDIYALGGILYNLLTLNLPICGASVEEIIHKIATGDIPPPTAYNPGSKSKLAGDGEEARMVNSTPLLHCPGRVIPQSLSAVTMKAMALKREDRYPTVQDLQKDIEAYQGGFATSAEGAGMLRQMALLLKRHKTEAALIASGLLVVIVLTTIFIFTILAGEKRARDNEARALAAEKTARASEKEARDNLARALTGEKMAKEEKEKAVAANEERRKALAEKAGAAEQAARANEERARAAEEVARASKEREEALAKATTAEKRAASAEKTAEEKLGVLANAQVTGPALFEQARNLVEEGKLEEALEKLAQAIKLFPNEADFHCLRGNALESLVRIPEAREAYARALECNPNFPLAAENMKLCEKILKDNEGKKEWSPSSLRELQEAMQAQGRVREAMAMLQKTGGSKEQLRAACQGVLKKAGWWEKMEKTNTTLQQKEDGTLVLDLRGIPDIETLDPLKGMPISELVLYRARVADLSLLRGMPLTSFSFLVPAAGYKGISDLSPLKGTPLTFLHLHSHGKLVDLAPLKGMPLKEIRILNSPVKDVGPLKGIPLRNLVLCSTQVNDLNPLQGMPLKGLEVSYGNLSNLAPLKGMPLEYLNLGATPVKDLGPLKGMPLKKLVLAGTKVGDLTPLKGMPLEDLNLTGAPVRDLTPLKGLPLKILQIDGCLSLKDFTPLADCKDLETLIIPEQCKQLDFLRKLPNLKRLDYGVKELEKALAVDEFFKRYGGGKEGGPVVP